MRRCRHEVLACVALAPLLAPEAALAQSADQSPLARGTFQRPHAFAQFDVGAVLLPGADVCVRPDDCSAATPGLLVSAWPLYRAHRHLVAGAGLTLGFNPTREVVDAQSPVPRTHSSNYFVTELTARYLPIANDDLELWVGATAGLVVITDSFRIERNLPEQHFVGESGSSLSTEGWSLAVTGGAAWPLSSRVKLGGSLRLGSWLLPDSPQRTALGDTASLSGSVPVLALAISLSYSPG